MVLSQLAAIAEAMVSTNRAAARLASIFRPLMDNQSARQPSVDRNPPGQLSDSHDCAVLVGNLHRNLKALFAPCLKISSRKFG
jgi:hypothetical protein